MPSNAVPLGFVTKVSCWAHAVALCRWELWGARGWRCAVSICGESVLLGACGAAVGKCNWECLAGRVIDMSPHVTTSHVTSRRVTSSYLMSCHVMSCRVVSCRVVSFGVMSSYVVSSRITFVSSRPVISSVLVSWHVVWASLTRVVDFCRGPLSLTGVVCSCR